MRCGRYKKKCIEYCADANIYRENEKGAYSIQGVEEKVVRPDNPSYVTRQVTPRSLT